MKKSIYAAPTVTVRGDVMEDTLAFKKANCGESFGRWCPVDPVAPSFGL
jgi:hypothetical protein